MENSILSVNNLSHETRIFCSLAKETIRDREETDTLNRQKIIQPGWLKLDLYDLNNLQIH